MTSRNPIGTDTEASPVVFIVDDDPGMRSALQRLFVQARLDAEFFASGAEFVGAAKFDRPGCILLDVGMPQMSGLEVQAWLKQHAIALPIVFLTGSADIPIAVAAMREGAADFVEKPFTNEDLVRRVRAAIEHHERRRRSDADRKSLTEKFERLTPREREVMQHVVAGRTSKEVARAIGASHRTVEIHRARLMEKMQAATLADLVRIALQLQAAGAADS